jgi:hypothetical protein
MTIVQEPLRKTSVDVAKKHEKTMKSECDSPSEIRSRGGRKVDSLQKVEVKQRWCLLNLQWFIR